MPTPHDVENYSIGKGILYIAEWSGGSPGAYVDVGNCPSFEIEPTLERLPHFSSRSGFRTKDKNPVIQTEYALTFDLDEIAALNLKVFIMGDQAGNILTAMTDVTREYALRFISDNPAGQNQTWDFWKATLSPNGAMQLIGEDWMIMSFTGEGLADVANHASSPYFDITQATTTTTTTTTTV